MKLLAQIRIRARDKRMCSSLHHPYKINLLHELNEDSYDRRLQLIEKMSERCIGNLNFLYNICFSNEYFFSLYGWKLNVWICILGNNIIGSFFLQGNSTRQMYLNLLQENILPIIREVIAEDNNSCHKMIFSIKMELHHINKIGMETFHCPTLHYKKVNYR